MSPAYRLMCCTQVAGILQGCAQATGRALDSDCIVEPVRGPLIPGFAAVKRAAKAAGMRIPPLTTEISCDSAHTQIQIFGRS